MFVFKLDSVLNYRKMMEERKIADFWDTQKKLETQESVLESIQSEKLLLLDQLKRIQKTGFHAGDVTFYVSYVKILGEKKTMQCKIVEQISQELEKKRRELLATVKDRKVMDILKERKFAEFKKDNELREAKDINEMAVQAFARKEK
jgi:flagellar protein FliJ